MPADVLETAVAAVAASCAAARRIQRAAKGESGGVSSVLKADASPVTVADFAVQAIVAANLANALGAQQVRLVGEESAAALREPAMAGVRAAVVDAVRTAGVDLDEPAILNAIDLGTHGGNADDFWTIDPIDGTKGFVRGEQYVVALARIEHGDVVEAVLGCPNLGRDAELELGVHPDAGIILVAQRGAGCWQRDEDRASDPGTRLQRASVDPAATLVACDSVELGMASEERRRRLLDAAGLSYRSVRLDSQAKYALVARGDSDIYVRIPRRSLPVEAIWDHAAGVLVAAEAGATTSDLDGRPLDFGRGRGLTSNRGVLACAPEVHDAIVRAAQSVNLDPFAAL